jgi:probable addiction module antidote protein
MTVKLSRYDTADFLKTEDDIEYYLASIAEDNDPILTAHALGAVARARGMSQLSRETGISRVGLMKALSAEGNPSFATITKVLDALGYRIDIVRKGFPARMGGSESDQRAQDGQSTEAPEVVSG